jgi:hypothetical protein
VLLFFSVPKLILRANTNLTRDWKKSYIVYRTWKQQKNIGYFFIFFSGELKIHHIPSPTTDFDAFDALDPSKGKHWNIACASLPTPPRILCPPSHLTSNSMPPMPWSVVETMHFSHSLLLLYLAHRQDKKKTALKKRKHSWCRKDFFRSLLIEKHQRRCRKNPCCALIPLALSPWKKFGFDLASLVASLGLGEVP